MKSMQAKTLKIGARSSALALAQANQVRDALLAAHNLPPEMVEILPMSTRGDQILNQSLNKLGGKGLFTQEIEAALLDGRIDMAVHSTKDMPAQLPDGLHLAAFLKREDPRDVFIGRAKQKLMDLPQGVKVGTSSIRRQALLRRLRPDLEIVLFRGNVQTRLNKLAEGVAEGTFLAYAGLRRLGLGHVASEILDPEAFVPAPAQGVITIEARLDDAKIAALLAPLNDYQTQIATLCERSFMTELDGSCRTPLGAYATFSGDAIALHGMILTPDGEKSYQIQRQAKISEAGALGISAAKILKEQAGEEFFAGWYE